MSARIAWQRAGGQVWRADAGGVVLTVMQVGYQKWVALAAGRETARCQCRSREAAQRRASELAPVIW